MTNMTLSIPDELAKKMKAFGEIRWSEIARRAIEERVNDMEKIEKIVSKSKLTKKDVKEISRKVNKSAYLRFKKNEDYY